MFISIPVRGKEHYLQKVCGAPKPYAKISLQFQLIAIFVDSFVLLGSATPELRLRAFLVLNKVLFVISSSPIAILGDDGGNLRVLTAPVFDQWRGTIFLDMLQTLSFTVVSR